MKKVTVEYFALLSQEAERSEETLSTHATTLDELFQELSALYHFSLSKEQIKVAVNQKIAPNWELPISEGDHIFWIPPLAGG